MQEIYFRVRTSLTLIYFRKQISLREIRRIEKPNIANSQILYKRMNYYIYVFSLTHV